LTRVRNPALKLTSDTATILVGVYTNSTLITAIIFAEYNIIIFRIIHIKRLYELFTAE